jgi:Zn-dependent peptidase ImmA (M78 family)
MNQSLVDIAELAEDIGSCNLYRGKVNLNRIVKKENIQFIKGNYGKLFLGQLVHYSNKFYIVLNNEQLTQCEEGRVRFTIAHELGHYFIDDHRTTLARGISLLKDSNSRERENIANLFAANLLMPKNHFLKRAANLEIGLNSIFQLKSIYVTSIESTIIRYVNINIATCAFIKWRPNLSYHYVSCSKKFIEKFQLSKLPPPIKYTNNFIHEQIDIIKSSGLEYVENATQVSKWIATVPKGSRNDLLGLEQTIQLGDFGAITLLVFT